MSGGLYPRCKKHGGDYVHLYKNEQKGFRPGGILSVYRLNQIQIDGMYKLTSASD